MTKELKPYRQKMTAKELQEYLLFARRGSCVKSKKGKGSYDRNKMKKNIM